MDSERLHQEDLQRLRGFRLIDDDFMNACFDENIEGTELILRIILNKPDLIVNSVRTQKVMKNLLGRDIWLDINASDSQNGEYDIEIQRSDKGADRKRARYHSSILDAHLLQPNGNFSDLPETYVIFITENDVIGGNLPIYTIDRQITNIGQPFNDGEHIIYVNGADKNSSTELGKLMHDFSCTNPDDMYYKQLADKVRYFKEDEKGVNAMCKAMEDMRNEAVERERIKNAKRMLEDGLDLEKVAEYSGLPIEKVRELSGSKGA
ncbi:nuclease [Eubacterium xylanophilum]|uniref:nuclease n=1 Tax=Eubacterium xylanophilum TaxID=39497 RepID=UPI0004AF7BA5|nr:nuclease [Eubacterium xylanophilum]